MKKLFKRIVSVSLTLAMLMTVALTQTQSVKADYAPTIITGNNKFYTHPVWANQSAYVCADGYVPSFGTVALSQTGDGSHYITIFDKTQAPQWNFAYASMNGDFAQYLTATQCFGYSSIDLGCNTTTPFANTKLGSRLTILNQFYLPSGTYNFTVVAATSDGGTTADFYVCPEIFRGSNAQNATFYDEPDKWYGRNGQWQHISNGTDYAIFILKADNGATEMGSATDYPIAWSTNDLQGKTGYVMQNNPLMYVVYKPFTYTINKQVNGVTSYVTTTSRYGVNDVSITAPSVSGYSFKDWSVSGSANGSKTGISDYDFQTYMTKSTYFYKVMFQNATITANYKPNNYTVTFDGNGGTPSQNTKTVTFDATYGTLPTATRTGYQFTGWYTAKTGGTQVTASNYYTTAGNTTLYARWTQNSYTVAYNSNKPSGASTTMSGSTANTACKYDVTSKTASCGYSLPGYKFTGWNTQANGNGTAYAAGANITNWTTTNGATITLYAQWTPLTYTVGYNSNTGSGSMSNSTATFDANFMTRQNAFVKTGYRFNGWTDNLGGSWSLSTPGVYESGQYKKWTYTSNLTLYAQWLANTYTVHYVPNTPTGTASGSMSDELHTYDSNKQLQANQFSLNGYTFNGWNTKADGTGNHYSNSAIVKNLTSTHGATVTLYAQWKTNSYDVYLDDNGATSTDHTDKVKVDYLTTLPDIVIPKQEFTVSFKGDTGTTVIEDKIVQSTFKGYYDENNKQYYDGNGKGVTWDKATDYTLVAKWTPGEIKVPDCEKDGFEFIGWDDDPTDPDNPIYEPGDVYIPDGDTDLIPIWKAEITIYDIDIFKFNAETGAGILRTHTGYQLVGNECTATEQKPVYIEYEGYIYKASTRLIPTMNKDENVIYRFYEPILSIKAEVFDADGNRFFNKKEAGLLDITVTGYPNVVGITFPDTFKNTKWTNPVTGNTVTLTDNTTVKLNITKPVLVGNLNFSFLTPDTNFDGTEFKIYLTATREEPCELFKQYVAEQNLTVQVETECTLMLDLGFNGKNYLKNYLSSIRSLLAFTKNKCYYEG